MAFQLPMPCRNVSDCFPCNDLPTTNKSSESQDVIEDFVIQWGNLQTNTPPLGSLFRANGCTVLCVSAVSQEDAFLCAQRSQALCVINNWQPEPPDPPICLSFPCSTGTPPTPPSPESFANQAEGCTANCDDGVGFTFTTAAGSFIAASQALADRMASSFACREAVLHRVCLSLIPPQICLDTESTITFIASGRFLSATSNFWEIRSGALPPGFSFSNTMAGPVLPITGTATASGDYSFTIRVTAPNGDFAERAYTVSVGGITTADPLPDADMGAAYSETLTSVGITGTLIWLIFDGDLPDGLTLDETTGEISGTPTETGDFEFTVSVSSETQGCEKVFHLTVVGCFIDDITPLNFPLVFDGATLFNNPQTTPATGGLWGGTRSDDSRPAFYFGRQIEYVDAVGSIHPGATGSVSACNVAEQIAGIQGGDVFWIDISAVVVRNVGVVGIPTGLTSPYKMLSNGKILMGCYSSSVLNEVAIYDPNSNMLLNHLVVPLVNETHAYDINEAETLCGSVLELSFVNRAVKMVYSAGSLVRTNVTLPADAGASIISEAGRINTAGHVTGYWYDGVNNPQAFFSGATQVTIPVGSPAIFFGQPPYYLNDSDEVAFTLIDTGTGFSKGVWWSSTNGTSIFGANGVNTTVVGINSDGYAIGVTNGQAFVYRPDIGIKLLTTLIDASAGWTAFNDIWSISDDPFVFGSGTLNGSPADFAAKLCI